MLPRADRIRIASPSRRQTQHQPPYSMSNPSWNRNEACPRSRSPHRGHDPTDETRRGQQQIMRDRSNSQPGGVDAQTGDQVERGVQRRPGLGGDATDRVIRGPPLLLATTLKELPKNPTKRDLPGQPPHDSLCGYSWLKSPQTTAAVDASSWYLS